MNVDPPRSTTHIDPIDLDLRLPTGTPVLAVGSLSEFPLERELLVVDARQLFIVDSRCNWKCPSPTLSATYMRLRA
ncbi:hypothetical protein B1987_15910 [Mycobacterium kansasii]|nr:hypothetical protein B1987_15910 [Mycobacterium kansasii]